MPRHRRAIPEINAGSMADIAFLLLIFFLVSTNIENEKGLTIKLPALPKSQQTPPIIQKRNAIEILITDQNTYEIESMPFGLAEVHEKLMQFITNPSQQAHLSESPQKATIIIKADARAKYSQYIALHDVIKHVYLSLRDDYSERQFSKHFLELKPNSQEAISVESLYPINVSEVDEIK